MQGRCLVAVLSSALLAWLLNFCEFCYYREPKGSLREYSNKNQPPFPNGELENIVWFLQISDIHISVNEGLRTATDLRAFCSHTLDAIRPAVVMATGDLTHGKYANGFSRQFQEEWEEYARVLRETGVEGKTVWLDLRGNHDSFDVPSPDHPSSKFQYVTFCLLSSPPVHSLLPSPSSLPPSLPPSSLPASPCRRYSSSWRHHSTFSYHYLLNTSFGAYSFLAMDACPSPGPRRPYNFFGILDDEDLDALNSMALEATSSNHTIWLSHYPSSIINTDHQRLRNIMSSSLAHVCGHLHTLGGFVPNMYGRQPGGRLELELGDFRFMKMYRILALDHDLLSFADVELGQWPVVLVTNPKDALYLLPSHEPTDRIRRSSHIRVLAFSPYGISSVKVWVGGRSLVAQHVGGGLYTVPWDPADYAHGLHEISVGAEDFAGHSHTASHLFSLDDTLVPLQTLSEWIILTDFRALFRMAFMFVWFSLISSLFMAWNCGGRQSFLNPLVRRKEVFLPLLFYIVYYGIGPWYVGELLEGVYGLVFVHGIAVNGYFISGSLTYLAGVLEVLLFQVPAVLYTSWLLTPGRSTFPHCYAVSCHAVFAAVCIFKLYTFQSNPYGMVAKVISPGLVWPLPLVVVLSWRSFVMSRRKLTIADDN